MFKWFATAVVPRVSEGASAAEVMALKAETKELRSAIDDLNNLKAQIDEVLLDWARYKTQLRRLAGQITKAAALDAGRAEVEKGNGHTQRSVDDLTREEIANLQTP